MSVNEINALDRQQATNLVATTLLGGLDTMDHVAVECAALRSVLWWLSDYGHTPVHVLRLLHATLQLGIDTRPGPMAVNEQQRRARLRHALNELASASDLFELPRGWLLPTPLRVVRLPAETDTWLLVGGFPSHDVDPELSRTITHHGAFRRVQGPSISDAYCLPSQSLEAWLGTPPREPEQWASTVIMTANLAPFEERDELSGIRVYVPSAPRKAPQAVRWTTALSGLPDGRYLARRDQGFGLRAYRVVRLQDSRVIETGSPSFGSGDARRCMYGLDSAAGNPVEARRTLVADNVHIELRSEIPGPEQRLLAALGVLRVTDANNYYPRTWAIPAGLAGTAEAALSALGIRIVG